MTDLVLRARTLGTHADAPLVEFAAVKFDRTVATFNPEMFRAYIDVTVAEAHGYKLRLSDLDRKDVILLLSNLPTPDGPLWECLAEFLSWLEWKPKTTVWSVGTRQRDDSHRLRDAFRRSAPLECPWRARDEQSFATLQQFHPEVQQPLLVEQYEGQQTALMTDAIDAARWLHIFFNTKR